MTAIDFLIDCMHVEWQKLYHLSVRTLGLGSYVHILLIVLSWLAISLILDDSILNLFEPRTFVDQNTMNQHFAVSWSLLLKERQ